MKLARLAVVSCAALGLAAPAEESWARGGRGGHAHSGHAHRPHVHSRAVFIAPVFFYPRPYYYPPPAYYYPPPAPVYIEQPPVQVDPQSQQYWYYCPSSQTYYPYVKDCAAGWQRVTPQPAQPSPLG